MSPTIRVRFRTSDSEPKLLLSLPLLVCKQPLIKDSSAKVEYHEASLGLHEALNPIRWAVRSATKEAFPLMNGTHVNPPQAIRDVVPLS